MRCAALIILAIVALSGCAPVFSTESLSLVDPAVSFSLLKENPERYLGRHILLGGVIAQVSNTPAGGELELVQVRVDRDGKPTGEGMSEGRFLARSSSFLDPLVYHQGLTLSLVGEVAGKKLIPLDQVDYLYPVISIREIHVWRPEEQAPPRFHFGIGIGTSF